MHAHETELRDAIAKYIAAHDKERDEAMGKGVEAPKHDFTSEQMMAMELATLKLDVVMLLSDIDTVLSTRRKMGRSGMQEAVLSSALMVLSDKVEAMRERGI